jgi:RNA polymerase sigma-70 factor, ECF subfamily
MLTALRTPGQEPQAMGLKLKRPPLSRSDFEALYQRHGREIWAMAYARWMDGDLALDIVQEAFLRYWKQLQSGREILNPRGWLLRVARNLAEDLAKSSFRRNGTQPPHVLNAVYGRERLPLENLEHEETFGQLREELEKMPAHDREILTLRYALDYDTHEIADFLEINRSAVHMRLTRARQRLVKQLSAQGVTSAI